MNDVRRGDIYYIAHSKCYSTNPELEAWRPGVVVSCDRLNENSPVVEVVYLTTKEKRNMPTHKKILCKIPSTALCENIYTIPKEKLGAFIRTCTDKEMEALDKGLPASLGISHEPVIEREEEPVETPIIVERNLYKSLYEELLNKVMAR